MKVKEIAKLIEGVVEGDGNIEITGLSGIETAKPGDMVFAMDEEKLSIAEKSDASCLLTGKNMRKSTKASIKVDNPKLSFILIYNKLQIVEIQNAFIHPTALVSNSARLGKHIYIGPHVSIEDGVDISDHVIIETNSVIRKNCKIGMHCHIHPNVTVYENSVIGNNIIIHSGVVIGADGFGYIKSHGNIYKFPQLGRVIIHDNVEIGANTTIDKGSLGETVIGQNTKIDNLCQIAHNVKIGKNVIIAGQSGIAGSSVVEDDVLMGGQVGIADNVKVGKNVTIGGQSGIMSNVPDGITIWGYPAKPVAQAKRQLAVLAWLTKNFKILAKNLK